MTAHAPLPDSAAWVISCSPHLAAEMLGRELGVNNPIVRNARARFRANGWSCRVAYVPCRNCGRTLVRCGPRSGALRFGANLQDVELHQFPEQVAHAHGEQV